MKLVADYQVIGNDAGHSFVARIEGTQTNQTQKAVLNGTITDGWLVGARVTCDLRRNQAVPRIR